MTRAVSPDSGLDLERTETVRQLAEQHASERGALMVVLRAVQSELGHIGRSDVETIADVLNLSIADVHGVVSFYKDFRTESPPEHTIHLCRAEACQSVGAEALYADARRAFARRDDVEPLTWANSVARGRGLWGKALTDYLKQYNRVAGIGINGETLPCDANVLTLSDETDALGMRKAHISFGYGSNEDKLNVHATTLMRQIWEAAGASDIWVLERVAHTLGTCRMGRNPDSSVVDAYGRSHEVENLWICDGSVFPSSLAANPALTIMALSLRTAGAFLKGTR